MSERLHYEYGDKTIQELIALQDYGCLNLEPGFQRKSVWRPADRRKLVASILEGYPIPSIFLHQRAEDGRPVYDVIDGKQRLETIFMFSRTAGYGRGGFDVPFQFSTVGDEEPYRYAWADLKKHKLTEPFLSYKIQTVEVKGELSDIVDLFVRINSTGKSLTPSERRHARFYRSALLREAERLARRYRKYLSHHHVMSQVQIDRMKDVELVSELLASILAEGPIQRKAAVDKAVGNEQINGNTLRRTVGEFKATISIVAKMFPELRSTRFHNISEFYTLFMVIWEMRKQNLILRDKKRNRVAQELLKQFSNAVRKLRRPTKKELEQHLGFSGLTVHKMLQTLIAERRVSALDSWPRRYQRRPG